MTRFATASQPDYDDRASDLDATAGETRPVPTDEVDRNQPPPSRFRRRMERFRGMANDPDGFANLDDESELKLQLMLLREENARLKSARHQPASPGTAIDRVRVLATAANESEMMDDAFSLLGDCLTIREGLDQVCTEMQMALDAVRERLDAIAIRVEATIDQTQDAAGIRG